VLRPETRARARALQILYAWDLLGRPPIATVIARVAPLWGPRCLDRAADLAGLAAARAAASDDDVARVAHHWRVERLGAIERGILRLALAELAEGKTPPRVVIDEAVRLAHWFAGSRAPGFVNGILDAVARDAGAL
jgi:N utilization substance protein B